MTQYISCFIEINTTVHFSKASSSKYRAIILIQTKINYFVHVSPLLLKKVEKKMEKRQEIKYNFNTGGKAAIPSIH